MLTCARSSDERLRVSGRTGSLADNFREILWAMMG
jgi:hypothetical protein